MIRSLRVVGRLGVVALLWATPWLHAQESARASGIGASAGTPLGTYALSEEVVVAPSLITIGARGTFQVVEIPVPAAFAGRALIRYTVEPDGLTPLLSRRTGEITVSNDFPGRLGSVLLTFSVPRRARAGTVPVARVQFSADGITPVEVPVFVAVDPTQSIELSVSDQLRGVRPGDRVTLNYRIMNLGNAPEVVEVVAIVPSGWGLVEGASTPTRLGANAMAERTLTVSVPLGSAIGSAMVRLVAQVGGLPVATAEVRLAVLDASRIISAGPVLTTSVGYGTGPDQNGASAVSASLEGQLAPGVRVSGRVGGPVSGTDQGAYTLSRLGLYRAPPSLTLEATQWGVTAGLASGQFTELTGLSFSHQGISARGTHKGLTAAVVAGRSEQYGVATPRRGEFAGARVGWSDGGLAVTGTATHLSDPRGVQRSLDALSLSATVPGMLDGTLSAELAQRRSAAATGLGWSAGYQRRTRRDHLSVRMIHAPGGSRAFARATDEVSVSASRMLSDWMSVSGGYWDSRDDASASFTRIGSRGWNAGAHLQVSEAISLGLMGRQSEFSALGTAGEFGTRDDGVVATLHARRGRLFGTLNGGIGRTSRFTAVNAGAALQEEGANRSAQGALGISLAGGTFEVAGRYDHNDQYAGRIPGSGEISVRASRVPLLLGNQVRILASGSARRSFYPGFGTAQTILTSELAIELAGGFSVGMSAERNPFLVSSGAGGWLFALRVDRRTALPALAHPTIRGVAYIDQNGNGQRDQGEPGFTGAIVRRGSASAVTGRNGEFGLPGTGTEAAAVDPLSLPRGWILGETRRDGGRYEFAVVAVEPVEVILTLAEAEHHRLRSEDLAPVLVLARHESGKVWLSRKTAANRALFDALPPGRYTIELDVADMKEPLEQVTRPVFTVSGTSAEAPSLEVVLRPRPVTIKRLDQAGGQP